jgi:putative N6-adenine-specific DNA methylase
VLAKEVAALDGARDVRVVPGGVEFAGPLEVCQRANLWLRTATRVLVRVGTVEAREFAKLRRRASTLPWARFLDGRTPIALHVSQARSRLYHTGAVAENLTQAIADRVALPEAAGPEGEAGPLGVFARGQEDVWTLSVDSSGELLHRRGWRMENAQAPLRETLAAAILALCEWDPQAPLVDPMCGAGTFPVEACALAMRLAPGLARSFAFERWPGFDAARFARLREEARARALPSPPAAIAGSDHAARAVEAARRNAERCGVLPHVALTRAELADVQAPPGRGLVVCNPPYGRRVGDPRALRGVYVALGRLLRERFAGWRAGILCADPRLDSAFGLRPSSVTPLQNGGLRVRLLRFDVRA